LLYIEVCIVVSMVEVRSQLAATLLAPVLLDFSVGGGVMRYSGSRPALPADLQGLENATALVGGGAAATTEAAQVMAALVLIARGELDAAHDIVAELGSV
jgi:hypothetical protein